MSDISYEDPTTSNLIVNTDEYRIRKLEISRAVTEERVKNLEESIDKLTSSVDELTKTMTAAKGGWRVILLQGSIIAGIVALALQLADFIRGGA